MSPLLPFPPLYLVVFGLVWTDGIRVRTRRSVVGWVVAFPDYLLRKRSDLWDGTGGIDGMWYVVGGGGGYKGECEREERERGLNEGFRM